MASDYTTCIHSPHHGASHSIFRDHDKENSNDYHPTQPHNRVSQHSSSHTSSLSFQVSHGVGESQDLVRLEPDITEEEDQAVEPPQQHQNVAGVHRGEGGGGTHSIHQNKNAAAQWYDTCLVHMDAG